MHAVMYPPANPVEHPDDRSQCKHPTNISDGLSPRVNNTFQSQGRIPWSLVMSCLRKSMSEM